MFRIALFLLLACSLFAADAKVFVVLWFDTEDYVEPAADDAALRIATDLEQQGVRATFKIVGEKARVLESRGRFDVIRALARHDIGYHSENHSLPPVPAAYLRELGWLDGAREFERREGQGVRDLRRIFGVTPSCYGQPGSSWGPQSYRALLRMGIPVYLDEGSHVGLHEQPFWFGGMLHVFAMGRFVMRASLREGDPLGDTLRKFDEAAAELRRRGGGTLSIYYHPTEFVTTEFWDAVNFSRGARPEREAWARPRLRTPEDRERAYRVLHDLVAHARQVPSVQFVTASDLPRLYQSPRGKPAARDAVARHLAERLTFLETPDTLLSAAEMLQILLGLVPREVEGPVARRPSTLQVREIPRPAFERAKADVVSHIETHLRLPAEVWVGAETLSLADFAATLAADAGNSPSVPVRAGKLEMESYISREPRQAFNWVIHPQDFDGAPLHELARLQTWTLKPARLR